MSGVDECIGVGEVGGFGVEVRGVGPDDLDCVFGDPFRGVGKRSREGVGLRPLPSASQTPGRGRLPRIGAGRYVRLFLPADGLWRYVDTVGDVLRPSLDRLDRLRLRLPFYRPA